MRAQIIPIDVHGPELADAVATLEKVCGKCMHNLVMKGTYWH